MYSTCVLKRIFKLLEANFLYVLFAKKAHYLFFAWNQNLYFTVFYSTVCTVQYLIVKTKLSCTVLHCTVLHCTTLHSTAQHYPGRIALHCTTGELHRTALHVHCTILYCTVLYYISL
jgi:hypothetical protein